MKDGVKNTIHTPHSMFYRPNLDDDREPFLFNPNGENWDFHQENKVNSDRVMIYARQENEKIYTALHVIPPSVQGLINAVSAKYDIECADIRFIFRQTSKGIIVVADDDMIRYYCNGDQFVMKVLANEEDVRDGKTFFDIVFMDDLHPVIVSEPIKPINIEHKSEGNQATASSV